MNKLAIISDIHGNIEALEAVADDIKLRKVDAVINLGDHASGPLWPKETIHMLMREKWINIQGNHDRIMANNSPDTFGPSDMAAFFKLNEEEINWLKNLPLNYEFENGILAFHGSPKDDTVYLLETIESGRIRISTPNEIKIKLRKVRSPLMLCGHTHFQRVVEIDDSILIVNPGSVGLPAYDDDSPEYHVVESGSPHARYAVIEKLKDKWRVDFIMVSYDYKKAAEKAARNNRPDWEKALKTGYM